MHKIQLGNFKFVEEISPKFCCGEAVISWIERFAANF